MINAGENPKPQVQKRIKLITKMDHTVVLSVALPIVFPELLILLVFLVRAPFCQSKLAKTEKNETEKEKKGNTLRMTTELDRSDGPTAYENLTPSANRVSAT